jgi:hypothetical protein
MNSVAPSEQKVRTTQEIIDDVFNLPWISYVQKVEVNSILYKFRFVSNINKASCEKVKAPTSIIPFIP